MNKTVLISAISGEPTATDHYGIFRNEGRIPINIGFGLSMLGYNINIVYDKFKEIAFISENGSVRLSKMPVKDYYDFKLYFNDCAHEIECGKEIAIINYTHEIHKTDDLSIKFVTPYKNLVEFMSNECGRQVDYLPQLNPIPTYNLGFKDFNFYPKTGMIKIFVYISAWVQNTHCLNEMNLILKRMKRQLDEKFNKPNIKLFIQVDSDDTKRQCKDIIKNGNEFIFVGKLKYDEYLRIIEDMDICIVKGSQFLASGGMYDIISMGKPMIYLSELLNKNQPYRNPLFQNIDEIIFCHENENSINRKIDKFIENPKQKYNIFRKCMEDSDFNNWKNYALEIFK